MAAVVNTHSRQTSADSDRTIMSSESDESHPEPMFYRGRCLPPPAPILLPSTPDLSSSSSASSVCTPPMSRRSSASAGCPKNVRFATCSVSSVHLTHSSESYDRRPIVPAPATESLVLPPHTKLSNPDDQDCWLVSYSRDNVNYSTVAPNASGVSPRLNSSPQGSLSCLDLMSELDRTTNRKDMNDFYQDDQSSFTYEPAANCGGFEPQDDSQFFGFGNYSRGDIYSASDCLGGF